MTEDERLMEEAIKTIVEASAGKIVKGTVLDVSQEIGVLVDIGTKVEGVIPLSEISEAGGEFSVGEQLDVYIVNMSGTNGHPTLSRKKALELKIYDEIENAYKDGKILQAKITSQIRGGVKADINGIEVFIPNSHLGYPPVRRINETIGKTVPVKIKTFSRKKGDIVASWKEAVEGEIKAKQQKFWDEVRVGEIREGTVTGITKFGAFVDIGGFEGLLHIKDISWGRTENVSDELKTGQKIKVKITKINRTEERVSLSLKDTMPHPWEKASEKYEIGSIHKGIVKSVVKFGAFVELEPGLEGLLHVSEISWKKNIRAEDILKEGEEIEVMVLNVDAENKKISLSLRNVTENPWQKFAEEHKTGDNITGTVKNLTKTGAFIDLGNDIEGFVSIKDFSWEKRIQHPSEMLVPGQEIQTKILEIKPGEQRISLGIKQAKKNPFSNFAVGSVVEGTITEVRKNNCILELPDGIKGFIHISQISPEKIEDLSGFKPGQKIKAIVVEVNENSRMVELSVKGYLKQQERETIKQYYSSESTGFSIGDILKDKQ